MAPANQQAVRLHHEHLAPVHILLGILREGANLAACVLTERGVRIEQMRKEILRLLRTSTDEDHARLAAGHDGHERIHQQELAKAFRSPKFWHGLILAVDSANRPGDGEVRDEHLLPALLRGSYTFVSRMPAEKGISLDWVRDRITREQPLWPGLFM